MERRLAAILATDVVGYSRLIRADEEGTIVSLRALRADLIDPKIAEHNGRIVKLMGDGMLAEFRSVVDAVRAAVETQQALAEHNSGLPEDKRIEFRVGINLGDVVIDGDDIQGDGVNVAARLEGLAKPLHEYSGPTARFALGCPYLLSLLVVGRSHLGNPGLGRKINDTPKR